LVVCAHGDISGDIARLKINGAVGALVTTDQAGGNYANSPINIGRRNNVSLPFNGRITSMTVRGGAISTAKTEAMERYVARRSGITL
jgi:hypothetical protein